MAQPVVIWLIPELIPGSGGHRTMLVHAKRMEQAGITVHICVEVTAMRHKAEPAKLIKSLTGIDFERVSTGWHPLPAGDVVIATSWPSAYVAALAPHKKKIYFVQDFEASFGPVNDSWLSAEHSYKLGLTPITIGRWLATKLHADYDLPPRYFDFGADLSVYKPAATAHVTQPQSICFIHQPDKPRRCRRLGLAALAIVQQKRPDVLIKLYGSADKGPDTLKHENLGLMSVANCAKLYQESTVGLCLSATNPSRVPFEMMAVGLPVVDLHLESTCYDMPNDAVLLADGSADAIADALLTILADAQLRDRMSVAAVEFMATRDSSHETEQFLSHFLAVMADEPVSAVPIEQSYTKAPVTAAALSGLPSPLAVPSLRRDLKQYLKKQARYLLRRHMG